MTGFFFVAVVAVSVSAAGPARSQSLSPAPDAYHGTLQITSTAGRSCYPDMVAAHQAELLVRQQESGRAGYLVITPGFAYAFTQADPGGDLTFARLALHERGSPYFAPRASTVRRDGDRLVLSIEWEPFGDCAASSGDLTLVRDSEDAADKLAFWVQRDQLMIAIDEARAKRRHDETERIGVAHYTMLLAERGPLSPDTMAAARGLARFRIANGQVASAADATRHVSDAARAARPATSRAVQLATNNLAGALADAGQFKESLTLFQQGYDEREALVDRLHVHQLDALVWISFLHGRLDNFTAARETAREAFERDTAFYGRGSEKSAESALNLFAYELRLGRALAALELAEYAYESRLKLFGPDAVPTLSALNGIAVINNTWLRRPATALPLFQQIYETLKAPRNRNNERAQDLLSAVAFNRANTQRASGLKQEALNSVHEAIELQEEFYRPTDARRYLSSLLQIALLVETGAAPAGAQQAEALLADINKFVPGSRPVRVGVLEQLASALRATGQVDRARQVFDEAYELAQAVLTPTASERISLLSRFSNFLAEHGPPKQAIARRAELVDSVEALMAQATALGDTRASAFAAHVDHYRELARALVDQRDVEQALLITQKAKARLLLESITLQGAVRTGDLDPAEREVLRKLDAARNAAEQRAVAAAPLDRPLVEVARNRAVREFNAYVETLRKQNPKFARLTQVEIANSENARPLLEPKSLFIDFVVGNQHTLIFLLARDMPLTAHVVRTPKELAAVVDAFRTALLPESARGDLNVWELEDGSFVADARRPERALRPVKDARPIGAWLVRQLLEPVGGVLRKYNRWVVAPDSAIAHLPFDALPWNGGTLAEHVVLSTTQSLSVYVQGRQTQQPAEGRAKRWLGFGAPDYATLNASLAARESASPIQLATRAPLRDSAAGGPFAPLPYALSELKSVSALFNRSTLVVGGAASEQRLRELDRSGELARFDILHLAAHATFHPQQPALSALVLAATGSSTETDGLLTAGEWTSLRLNSELVVMSACETGIGQRVSGEGVLGMPYALFVAGNRNALLTLWPVADEATGKFIRAFFGRLVRGEPGVHALAATKRDFIAGKFGKRERDPFYWAPFLFVGPG
ncbi:MAG: CHAT domain-containing protein [Pseudomonadota bacterium]|nr:CHAT domain-containing protein [Pseudomonadota bacterium]